MKAPTLLARIVATFGHLKQLTAQAERLAALDAMLRERLPQPLAAHVRLAAIHDGCVVVMADGAAWATQMRYRTPELLAALPPAAEFAGVQSVRVRVERAPHEPAPPQHRAHMSADSAAAIRAQAATTDDERLQAALERLARRGAPPE